MATLAARIGNQAALRATLRRGVGLPSDSVLVPDATADDALREGLSALNLKKPIIGTGTFVTVADQQAYNPLPADALGFRRVFWPRAGSCHYASLLGSLGPFMASADELGTRTSQEPGAILALQRTGAWLRRLSHNGGARIEGATVYLMPVPDEAGVEVVFTYAGLRYATVALVEEVDARAFWAATEAWLHRALAAGAGAVTDVADTSEGTRISTKAAEHHLKLAATRERSFHRMFPPPPSFP